MSLKALTHLISEAQALAGENTCVHGHDWVSEGGRTCPNDCDWASQPVFVCSRCGENDYGEVGGPGHAHCESHGPTRLMIRPKFLTVLNTTHSCSTGTATYPAAAALVARYISAGFKMLQHSRIKRSVNLVIDDQQAIALHFTQVQVRVHQLMTAILFQSCEALAW